VLIGFAVLLLFRQLSCPNQGRPGATGPLFVVLSQVNDGDVKAGLHHPGQIRLRASAMTPEGNPSVLATQTPDLRTWHLAPDAGAARALNSPPRRREAAQLFTTLLSWSGCGRCIFILVLQFLRATARGRGASPGGVELSPNQGPGSTVPDEEGRASTFADVAGVDEAKAELLKIVDFLKKNRALTNGDRVPASPKGSAVGPPAQARHSSPRAVGR